MDILTIVSLFLAYFTGATITTAIMALKNPYGVDAEEVYIGLVWPISVPVILFVLLYLRCVMGIMKITKKTKPLIHNNYLSKKA